MSQPSYGGDNHTIGVSLKGSGFLPAEWVPNRVLLVTIGGNLPLISRAKLDDLNLDLGLTTAGGTAPATL